MRLTESSVPDCASLQRLPRILALPMGAYHGNHACRGEGEHHVTYAVRENRRLRRPERFRPGSGRPPVMHRAAWAGETAATMFTAPAHRGGRCPPCRPANSLCLHRPGKIPERIHAARWRWRSNRPK